MERIQALIDKLYQQKQQNSNPAQLLLTVQLLQTELLKLQLKNGTLGTAKVAVTLPVYLNFSEETDRSANMISNDQIPEPVAEKTVDPQPQPQPQSSYSLPKPEIKQEEFKEPAPAFVPSQVLNPAFSNVVEAPTLSQNSRKELHEAIAEKKESLNDRLKQEKTELAHTLKETPIKDLRKGIGINDRFTFVNELFRNDEAMYERSIKTINGFHILSEAEYWINRELKFKLGWNDSKDVVQHFYQIVRRRFL